MVKKNNVSETVEEVIVNQQVRKKIKVLYIITSFEKTGPIQQLYNLISNLDKDLFEVKLITVYDEKENVASMIEDYKNLVSWSCIKTSKLQMLLGCVPKIKQEISAFNPDVIHTSGVFPDYMVSRMRTGRHVMTSRNFVYDDYISKYGNFRGNLMVRMHLYVMTHTKYSRVCSESLHNIYIEKLGIDLPFIRNGVDIEKYFPCNDSEKRKIRIKLGLPTDSIIIVYGAGFNERKNHEFLLRAYLESNCFKNTVLLLLGRGQFYDKLKDMYGQYKNILMPGSTTIMNEYLRASDYYVSTSKSEGLPNGVIEALASGLPVLLSDIPQHAEILSVNPEIGYLYKSDDVLDFSDKMDFLLARNKHEMSSKSRITAETYFGSKIMSQNYQDLYKTIVQDHLKR